MVGLGIGRCLFFDEEGGFSWSHRSDSESSWITTKSGLDLSEESWLGSSLFGGKKNCVVFVTCLHIGIVSVPVLVEFDG